MTTRVFTGLKPTGQLQIGNYLGAIRPVLDLADDPANEVLVCVVDLHALTVDHDPTRLWKLTLELAATLLACGLDPRASLFLQSSVPAHTELSYLLESTAAYGEMTRMVQFKEKSAGRDSVRLSLLTYPALMAADILVHQTEVVPVGDDQQQHLELTTTLARRFNTRYGEVFTVPRAITPVESARIKDLRDPRAKMGKTGSDGAGVIYLRDAPGTIVAKVRRAVTDPDPVLSYDPTARPGIANLAALLGALTRTSAQRALHGLTGAAALKQAVADALVDTLAPIQKRYAELIADPAELQRLLRRGRDAVTPAALRTVTAARHAMGLLEAG
ncbi:MAG: tryptophan--tRNA ligase [Frankiales bacterium]|nr:tryptophan--tRNA ligase [Frankiales bacterium]